MAIKVLYIVPPTKTYAGIERVIDEICDELAGQSETAFDISVLYMSHLKGMPARARRYNRIQTDTKTRRGLISTVRKVVADGKYDLVVVPQVEATVICWASCLGLGSNFVLYLHGNPNLEMRSFKARVLFFVMKKIVLHRLAAVFGISPKQLASFKTVFPGKPPHCWVPNPVRKFGDAPAGAAPADNTVTFVNVGRFCHQKGQDILLRAFAKLYALRSNARLKIVGYGDEEPLLRQSITALGLEGVASIEHHPENPEPALRASQVYVSTSRWEGWSLAICEALRLGLPVVATDCEFGPSDILTDERLGRLVPVSAEDQLVQAMVYYCDNIREEQSHSRFRQDYIDRYSAQNVVHLHTEALSRASQPRVSA